MCLCSCGLQLDFGEDPLADFVVQYKYAIGTWRNSLTNRLFVCLQFKSTIGSEKYSESCNFVVGADGAFSRVREELGR